MSIRHPPSSVLSVELAMKAEIISVGSAGPIWFEILTKVQTSLRLERLSNLLQCKLPSLI